MKLVQGFVASSVLHVARLAAAAATVGHVYLHDPIVAPTHTTSQTSQTLSPEAARLVFAQRLGLSRFHSLGNADDATIQQIDNFGGKHQQLFGHDEEDSNGILVVVEGVENHKDLITNNLETLQLSNFELSSPPDASANTVLMKDFSEQTAEVFGSKKASGEDRVQLIIDNIIKAMKGDVDVSAHGNRLLVHVKSLQALLEKNTASSTVYKNAVKELSAALDMLANVSQTSLSSLAIALMPPTAKGHSKRSANPYGEYDTPKRSPIASRPSRPEAILTEAQDYDSSVDANGSSGFLEDQSHVDAASPLRGIRPSSACFTSQSDCESSTNSCSGHGKCVKKEIAGKTCYSCHCAPSVRTNEDGGKKTTYYGGSACHKVDVTMPFWLLASFTVGIVFVISWAVGLLYTMGNEELPSVIGAGVSGPRAK